MPDGGITNYQTQAVRPEDPGVLERQEKALELRAAGLSYREIGKVNGTSANTAWRDVEAAMALTREAVKEQAEHLRDIELRRLDKAQRALQSGVNAGDPKAVHAMLKVMERRARLLGLDAPTKIANTDTEGRDITPISITFRDVNTNEIKAAHGNPDTNDSASANGADQ